MLKIFKKKEKSVETADQTKIPNHVAFICDGNRRWAKDRGLPALEGHRAGISNFENLVDWYIAHGVSTVSFWIFSTENWDRSKEEVDFLMSLFYLELKKNLKHAIEKNLRYKIVGRRDRIPAKLAKLCDDLEERSAEGTAGTVVFCMDHGGRDEIARAVAEYGDDFELHMDTADLPDVDMIVRTSNERRTSGFMSWKAVYAELNFIPQHWPEFVKSENLWQGVLDEFARRNRRFGGGKEKNYSGKKK